MFETLKKEITQKMKLADFHEVLGISERAFMYKLAGEKEFTLKEVEISCNYFGKSCEELFRR